VLYNVRMRAAQGGDHALGGRHISGAERLARPEEVTTVTQEMLARALGHSRGRADFISITIEEIKPEDVHKAFVLPVTTVQVADTVSGRVAAKAALTQAGVNSKAAEKGFHALTALPDSMRGAMLLCAATGKRLDDKSSRGVRVSRMDVADKQSFAAFLSKHGLAKNVHAREALVLATKVAAAPGVVAELCWSDDPDYTAGYVASVYGYFRFPHLKDYGNPVGGRVFFVEPGCNIAELTAYLEQQPVLVAVTGEEAT
jgi:6-carboxyhexanoate--CoA ligase